MVVITVATAIKVIMVIDYCCTSHVLLSYNVSLLLFFLGV